MRGFRRVAASALLCAGTAGCGGAPAPPKHLILISLDTLRADRIVAGAGSPMPNLARFAGSAIVFENATTPIPFTPAAHMSMLTGLYPDVHEVNRQNSRLSDSIPTLAEELRKDGFATHGLYSNVWMAAKFGFDRGFEGYEKAGGPLEPGPGLLARALELLPQSARSAGRQFLFLHLYDAHSDFEAASGNELPYFAPPDVLRARNLEAAPGEFCAADGKCATEYLMAANEGRISVDEAARRKIERLYDAGVAALDLELGKFFAELERRGYLGNSLIVVLSDHGEEFRDHGQFLHNQLHGECVRIPFLVRPPGGAGARRVRDDRAEAVDVLPTMLAAAGLALPRHVQGRALLAADAAPRAQAFLVDRWSASRFGLIEGRYKILADLESGESALFDLLDDPGERNDLASRNPDLAARLVNDLRGIVRRHGALRRLLSSASPDVPISGPAAEELRSLGYL